MQVAQGPMFQAMLAACADGVGHIYRRGGQWPSSCQRGTPGDNGQSAHDQGG